MASPAPGVGFLLVNDILTDCAFTLFENSVNTVVPAGGIAVGAQIVNAWDDAMYVGAQIIVGIAGTDLEVVTITATMPGTSFSATFVYNHAAGEPIQGATFPVRQTTDPLFTQPEMLAYISTAYSDFLNDCPLVYAITENVTVAPAAQNAALPSDSMFPVRIAPYSLVQFGGYGVGGFGGGGYGSGSLVLYFAYCLRETSQSNLDQMDYRWQQEAADQPYCYFRDKVPFQNVGIWPRANNTVKLEIVYAQRGPQLFGLADGFSLPDPFLYGIKYRVLSFAFSKSGEGQNPGLAKYFAERYGLFVKIANMFLAAIQDPNLEMASQ